MEPFPYLAGFSTFILTLAVAHLLKGLTNLAEIRQRVRWDALFLALVSVMLPFISIEWWVLFRWRTFTDWTLPHFWFLAIKPILLYTIATFLIPRIPAEGSIDLAHHLKDIRPFVFGLLAFFVLLDLPDTMLKGWDYFVSLLPGSVLAPLFLGGLFLTVALTKRRVIVLIAIVLLWLMAIIVPLTLHEFGAL